MQSYKAVVNVALTFFKFVYNCMSLLSNNMAFVATTASLLPMPNMVQGSCSSFMLIKMVQKGRKGRVLSWTEQGHLIHFLCALGLL